MSVPSIKATAFQTVADDLQRLLAEGSLSPDALEVRLCAEDLPYLDEKLLATTWVPIATYARAVELLAATEAPGGREAYLVGRGERSAERLVGLGLYAQLDATTASMGPRIGHVIVTLARAIYNFTEWHYASGEDGEFTIRVEDAAAFPEVSRFATQGFVQFVARRASGRDTVVVSRRPSADTVQYLSRPAL